MCYYYLWESSKPGESKSGKTDAETRMIIPMMKSDDEDDNQRLKRKKNIINSAES